MVKQSQLTDFKTHFGPERYVEMGRALHTEKELICCHFKSCSVQMRRWST